MGKEFPEMSLNNFTANKGNRKITESNRALPFTERLAIQEGRKAEQVEPVCIWHLNPRDSNREEAEAGVSGYRSAVSDYNSHCEEDERGILFKKVSPRDFKWEMQSAYDSTEYTGFDPDIVILDGSNVGVTLASPKNEAPLAHALAEAHLSPIKEIREAVSTYHKRALYPSLANLSREKFEDFFHGTDKIDEKLTDHFLVPPGEVLLDTTQEITNEIAMSSALYTMFDDNNDVYNALLTASRHYLEEDDFSTVEQIITDDLLRESIQKTQEIDIDQIRNDHIYDFMFRHHRTAPNEDRTTATDEIKFKTRLADIAQTIDLKGLKTFTLQALRNGLDAFKEEFLLDEDWDSWTERILQPVIVSTSPDVGYQRKALELGADAIPMELLPEELTGLAVMAASSKGEWVSMARERTQRFKRQFYERHQAELEERAVDTADTTQELAILHGILSDQQIQAQEPLHILDVGCGTGRITLPLSEQYHVTGIDASEHFLEKAEEQASDNQIEFRKGDIIDYKGVADPETYTTVMYTWHSFLEAYGVGNTLETLTSAWLALKPGGTLIFDQPTRENKGMEDGWYEFREDSGPGYVAYLMDEEELLFMLKMSGFDGVELKSWTTTPSELYPDGMKKWTVTAQKPQRNTAEEEEDQDINEKAA